MYKIDTARNWLMDILADGPWPVRAILIEGENVGITKKQLYKAKESLKLKSIRIEKRWHWKIRVLEDYLQ